MPYQPFPERFPEIAEAETRAITNFDCKELPLDTYGLIEAYCNDADCDCRRVFLNVMSDNHKKILAVIAFGWERRSFYAKWLGTKDSQMLDELKGPSLNLASPQSDLAPKLLKLVTDLVLHDERYVERLKRHYKLFRDDVNKESQNRKRNSSKTISTKVKVGRNEPCPCGSGKKSKNCCL